MKSKGPGAPSSLFKVGNFWARYSDQIAYERKAFLGGEEYSTASGDYSSLSVVEYDLAPKFALDGRCSAKDPRLVSNFLANRIRQLLNTSSKPVIVVDVGGEFGYTASWLASIFSDAIDASYLAIAVTNLAPSLKGHDSFLSEDEVDSVHEIRARARNRVQGITSNARRLPTKTVTLKDGTEINLRGNVSLAHESASVRYWSLTPGIDTWRVSQIISPDGLYIVDELDCLKPYVINETDPTNMWFSDRRTDIEVVHSELGRLGLNEVNKVEEGIYTGDQTSYVMFKGPEALPICI